LAVRTFPILRALVSIAGGVCAAIAAVELGLRPFESANAPPWANIAADSFGQPSITYRQLEEGVAVSHFSEAGARLTGNAPISGAPVIALLGDSYVLATGVGDTETLGSQLERTLRASGWQLNVRQYGWNGASPSRYLVAAHTLEQRWHPAAVVIALSDNDVDDNALSESAPHIRVRPDTTIEVLAPIDSNPAPPPPRTSTLKTLLEIRTWRLRFNLGRGSLWGVAQAATHEAAPAKADVNEPELSKSEQLALLPAATVRSLSATFGPKLSLVYLSAVPVTGADSAPAVERSLLEACVREHVRCASTRARMLAARELGHIAHGFSTTTPGNGHMNAVGHAIAAHEAWRLLTESRAQLAAVRQH